MLLRLLRISLFVFYNWIDSEAATTGSRATVVTLDEILDGGAGRARARLYAAQRDKHQSYVVDITKAE